MTTVTLIVTVVVVEGVLFIDHYWTIVETFFEGFLSVGGWRVLIAKPRVIADNLKEKFDFLPQLFLLD